MSHALSRLRVHFDDPLVVAVGREFVLTERAKALVEPVSDAVARLERVFKPVEPFDPRTSRRVFRIAATDNLELFVLPRLAAVLQKEAPGIDIRVCALPDDWVTCLQRGDIDLKLGRKYAVPATVESQDLSHERFTCVTRGGHPARRKLTVREAGPQWPRIAPWPSTALGHRQVPGATIMVPAIGNAAPHQASLVRGWQGSP